MKNKIKAYRVPLLVFLAVSLLTASLLLVVLPLKEEAEIYDKVIRLHILANSDSEYDQEIKLRLRDRMLSYVEDITVGCADKEEAAALLADRQEEIRQRAEEGLRELGCTLPVAVTLGQENYPTREYDAFRLPAGEYTSLQIRIGEAAGHNWWCVLFPPLCTASSAPKERLAAVGFTPGQISVITETENTGYVLRFRLLEILSSLFRG